MTALQPRTPALPDRRPALRAAGGLIVTAVVLFVVGTVLGLTLIGRHGGGPIQGLDNHAWRWFIDHRYLVGLAKFISVAGDAAALGVICVVITIGLLVWRRSPLSLIPIVAYLGAETEVYAIRELVHRHRPVSADFPGPHALPGIHETSWSFPSGHATAVTAVLFAAFGALALTRRTVWPWLVALVLSGYVASTRPVLGVHWLSDVVIGLLIGICWGVAVAVVATRLTWDDLRALFGGRRTTGALPAG